MCKDLLAGSWKGPDALITSGRGYACVFPQDADSPIWIPGRLIWPFNQRASIEESEEKAETEREEDTEKDDGA